MQCGNLVTEVKLHLFLLAGNSIMSNINSEKERHFVVATGDGFSYMEEMLMKSWLLHK